MITRIESLLAKEAESEKMQRKMAEQAAVDRPVDPEELDIGSLPVCGDSDKLIAINTDRGIAIWVIADGCEPRKTLVNDVMTLRSVYCFEDELVVDATSKMEAEQIRGLAVLNKDERLVGIVSLGELAVRGRDERLSGEALEQVYEPVAAC